MRILIVTDAWEPQVNGVVRTLQATVGELRAAGHEVGVISPDLFRSLPCPSYPEIRLALAGRRDEPHLVGLAVDGDEVVGDLLEQAAGNGPPVDDGLGAAAGRHLSGEEQPVLPVSFRQHAGVVGGARSRRIGRDVEDGLDPSPLRAGAHFGGFRLRAAHELECVEKHGFPGACFAGDGRHARSERDVRRPDRPQVAYFEFIEHGRRLCLARSASRWPAVRISSPDAG